jgi:hypothetical protein
MKTPQAPAMPGMTPLGITPEIFKTFPGIKILDTEPQTVSNPYTGDAIVLTPEELAVYDYVKGCELFGDYQGLQQGIEWFIDNNIKAYSVLLD